MMARSGGFNVPHDFFKPAKRDRAGDAAQSRKPWPTLRLDRRRGRGGRPRRGDLHDQRHERTPSPKPDGDATRRPPCGDRDAPRPRHRAEPPRRPRRRSTTVALAATPEDRAGAYRDGSRPSDCPALLDVEDGKTVAHRDPRATATRRSKLELDGKEASKLVELKPLRRRAARSRAAPAAKPDQCDACKKGETSILGIRDSRRSLDVRPFAVEDAVRAASAAKATHDAHLLVAGPDDVLGICRRLRERGKRGWIVGGCVRDLLRGAPAKDWDVATDARPDEVVAMSSAR